MKNKNESRVIFTNSDRYCSIESYLTNHFTKSKEDLILQGQFELPDVEKWENTGKKYYQITNNWFKNIVTGLAQPHIKEPCTA